MPNVTITLAPEVAQFYTKIAQQMQLPLESVLSDALFKLAGELSVQTLRKN